MSATASVSTSTGATKKAPITITPAAALKSWELIQEEQNPELKLRISILGGGCHGFQYSFSFSEITDPDDIVIIETVKNSKVHWVVDMISAQLLSGIEIDYKSDLNGERFIIRNLKVKTTCSCGHSFSVPDADESDINE